MLPPPEEEKIIPKKIRKYSESETTRKFKELLKEPDLIFQVKEAISNSRLLLHKTQNNNSKFSYIKYRKDKGAMGSLSFTKVINQSKSITRNHSSSMKTEGFPGNHSLTDIFDVKSEGIRFGSRPISASTVKCKPSRPRTAKRPITGGSLASTVPLHKEDFYHVNTFRQSIMESYQRKK